jgi:hypothetical protein
MRGCKIFGDLNIIYQIYDGHTVHLLKAKTVIFTGYHEDVSLNVATHRK